MTIKAVYENGLFKPIDRVVLPEHTRVDVSLPSATDITEDPVQRQAALWKMLDQRFDGGDPRVAERHNEHQP